MTKQKILPALFGVAILVLGLFACGAKVKAFSITDDLWSWEQVNEDGFGDKKNYYISQFLESEDAFYAVTLKGGMGTSTLVNTNETIPSFQTKEINIYRTTDGKNWQLASSFSYLPEDTLFTGAKLVSFKNHLFLVGKRTVKYGDSDSKTHFFLYSCSKSSGCAKQEDWQEIGTPLVQYGWYYLLEPIDDTLYLTAIDSNDASMVVYSTTDGTNWQMLGNKISGSYLNKLNGLVKFKDKLYIFRQSGAYHLDGTEVYRYENDAWQNISPANFGGVSQYGYARCSEKAFIWGDYLYFSSSYWPASNQADFSEMWRTSDGTNWEKVIDSTQQIMTLSKFIELGDYLYGIAEGSGGIWRTSDGKTWKTVAKGSISQNSNGTTWDSLPFHNINLAEQMVETDAGSKSLDFFYDLNYQKNLYSATDGSAWASHNGIDWRRISPQQFGDISNQDVIASAVFKNNLYLATYNVEYTKTTLPIYGNWYYYTFKTGTEVWRTTLGPYSSTDEITVDDDKANIKLDIGDKDYNKLQAKVEYFYNNQWQNAERLSKVKTTYGRPALRKTEDYQIRNVSTNRNGENKLKFRWQAKKDLASAGLGEASTKKVKKMRVTLYDGKGFDTHTFNLKNTRPASKKLTSLKNYLNKKAEITKMALVLKKLSSKDKKTGYLTLSYLKNKNFLPGGMIKKTLKYGWKVKTNLRKNLKSQWAFQYSNTDLKKAGLKEKNLALYMYNAKTKTWTKLKTAKQNKANNKFTVNLTYFKAANNYFVIGEK